MRPHHDGHDDIADDWSANAAQSGNHLGKQFFPIHFRLKQEIYY